MKRIGLFMGILLALTGCVEKEDMCCDNMETDPLHASWLLYETGYSPGAGYITEDVPASPSQMITFKENNRVLITVKSLEDIRFYKILEDSVTHTPVIAFYKGDPEGPVDTSAPKMPTYSYTLTGDVLKLYFRWCVEGCHMAFRKVE